MVEENVSQNLSPTLMISRTVKLKKKIKIFDTHI